MFYQCIFSVTVIYRIYVKLFIIILLNLLLTEQCSRCNSDTFAATGACTPCKEEVFIHIQQMYMQRLNCE